MTGMDNVLFTVFEIAGGLAFFLFGMKVMSANLERMAGGKLEHMLKKVTANPFVSLVLGAVITIAMQSSSATTVMLVGLVNSGIMQFAQTVSVIFGANIGTTLTSWILSLSSINSENFFIQMLKPSNFSPIVAFVGIMMIMFSKKDKRVSIGYVLAGFAILMYGMTIMSDAVRPLSDNEAFRNILVRFENPILAVLLGLVFTAVIQSSAASIGILQALSMSALPITFRIAIPIIMGQNIGTCATSLISCIGSNVKAKRVAALHVSIKIIGTVICLSLYLVLDSIFAFSFSSAKVNPFSIAMIHTLFNLAITVILMPFSKLLVKFTEKLVRDKAEEEVDRDIPQIDDLLFRQPSVVLSECDNGVNRMAQISYDIMIAAIENMHDFTKEHAEHIEMLEQKLDNFEDRLGTYLVRLSSEALSESDSRKISKMLHTIGDFERLGDHALNLMKVSKEIDDKKLTFSEDAQHEIAVLTDAIRDILSMTILAYRTNDPTLASRVEPLEQVIDHLIAQIKNNHITRLTSGNCTIETGFVLADYLTNYERVSDHCSNIAVAVIELANASVFDTHEYLNAIKYGNEEFNKQYDAYSERYAI